MGSQQLGSSFLSSRGGAAALGGSIMSLWINYDALDDAQLKVDKTTLKLNMAIEAEAEAETKLNVLVVAGKIFIKKM
jgi:hypothetical protein